jgi:hypothetical protein
MDLNHARLPIPPRWQLDCVAAAAFTAADQEDQPFYSTDVLLSVKRQRTLLQQETVELRSTGRPRAAVPTKS